MASPLTFTGLEGAGSATLASIFTTSSLSFTANRPVLIGVASWRDDSGDPVAPTSVKALTGNLFEASLITSVLFDTTGTSRARISLWSAIPSASGSSVVTINFSGVGQSTCGWAVVELNGAVNTSQSAVVVQSNTGVDDGNNDMATTLASFANVDNGTVAFSALGADQLHTAEGGYTEVYDFNAGDSRRVAFAYIASNDTSVNATYAGTGNRGGLIGVEVAAMRLVGGSLLDSTPEIFTGGAISAAGLVGAVRLNASPEIYTSGGAIQQQISGSGVLDTFNRGTYGPPVANGWLDPIFGGNSTLQVIANELGVGGSGLRTAYWQTTGLLSAFVTVTVRPNTSRRVELYLCVQDPGTFNENLYRFRINRNDASGDSVQIDRFDLGSVFATFTDVPITFEDGDSFYATKVGSALSLYQKAAGATAWTLIASATDSQYASGFIGLGVSESASPVVRLDNFGSVPDTHLLNTPEIFSGGIMDVFQFRVPTTRTLTLDPE